MTSFNIDFKALESCAPAMSNEETRYYLKGVHIFEKDGNIIYEATNGHYLIQVVSKVLQDGMETIGLNIILPAFIVKELSKKSFQKGFEVGGDLLVSCVLDGARISIEMIEGLINYKLIDGTFPDTEAVIPKKGNCRNLDFDAIGLDGKYLSNLSKSLKAYTGFGILSLKFSGDSGVEPILVECSSPYWKAVLMPVRV